MQISKALKRSRHGSLHFGRRLSIVLLVALLIVAIALVAFRGFAEFSVAGNPENPGTPGDSNGNIGSSINPYSSSNDEGDYSLLVFPAPEFGFGGAGLALLICFIAFALFMKRGSLKANHT
jgi:hypothetical protein